MGKRFINNNKIEYRIRKRVIVLGLSFGLLVNQIMIFQTNRALAVDINNQTQITTTPQVDFNPLDIINKINQNQVKRIQNNERSNSAINYPNATQQNYNVIENNSNKLQNENCQIAFGIHHIREPYSNKIYIWKVENNSPAYRAGIRSGDEIIKIHDEKTKSMSTNQIINRLNNNSAQLEIKNSDNQKRIVHISKSQVCIPIKPVDTRFEAYFSQLYPEAEKLDEKLEMCEGLLTARLSPIAKRDVLNTKENLVYWKNKRTKFRNGYTLCLTSGGASDANNCINQLLTREQAQINYEQQLAQQQAQFEAQQQLYRQQMAQQQSLFMQQSLQASAEAAAQREHENRQMLMNSVMQNSPFQQQPKYRFYDRYGNPQGYVQQSNW